MIWIILGAIGAWIFLKLLFNFILPVYRTTKQVRQQFNQMNQAAQENRNQPQPPPKEKYTPKKEYIEFEEIK